MDILVNMIYDADLIMCSCKIIVFIFSLEALAHLVGVIVGLSKSCLK